MPALCNRRSGRRGRPAGPFVLVLIAAVLLAAACSSPGKPAPAGPSASAASTGPAKTVVLPGTPAGAQLRWLIAAARLPISDAQARAHFAAAYLAQISPAMLSQGLQGMTGVVSIQFSEPSVLLAIISASGAFPRAQVYLTVDSAGLISFLSFSPAAFGPVPGTWAGVDAALRSVAPQVRLLVANVSSGSCQPVHGMDPATAAPIGSASKLYVLDALGKAVAAGTVRWNQPLTVTAQLKSTQLKSMPGGQLQNEPDGTRISVQDTAAYMIAISDNTATDMLINLLGRPAVEAALTTTGMASPALDRAFLTARELFTLTLHQWPALANRYLAANEAGRRALLASTIDRAPLPGAAAWQAWTAPRAVNGVGWFASADDICRLYASLAALARRPGLAPIGQVLSLNDAGLALDPAQWKTTWSKGGDPEPQVLTLAYLATTRTGQSYVVTVLAENPSQPINPNAALPVMLSAIRGAFTLAARR